MLNNMPSSFLSSSSSSSVENLNAEAPETKEGFSENQDQWVKLSEQAVLDVITDNIINYLQFELNGSSPSRGPRNF